MSSDVTCFTSLGVVGRRRTKMKRLDARLARRAGALPPPSRLLAIFELQDVGPEREAQRRKARSEAQAV